MKFEYDNWVLLGGGKIICSVYEYLLQYNENVRIIISPRRCNDIVYKNITLLEYLNKNNCQFECLESLNNLSINERDLGISLGAAWIFKKPLISKFGGKLINFHSSDLPKNRGGGGLSWRIMSGNRSGAATAHLVDEGIDTGDIVLQKFYTFPINCRIPLQYEEFLIEQEMELFKLFYENVKNNYNFELIKQQEWAADYWPRLSTQIHGFVDWNWNIDLLDKFVCAFDDPYIGASTFWSDKRCYIKKCFIKDRQQFHPFQYGIVYNKVDKNLYIASDGGTFVVGDIRGDDGSGMFECINIGDRLYTPNKYLDDAKKSRIIYTSSGILIK